MAQATTEDRESRSISFWFGVAVGALATGALAAIALLVLS